MRLQAEIAVRVAFRSAKGRPVAEQKATRSDCAACAGRAERVDKKTEAAVENCLV